MKYYDALHYVHINRKKVVMRAKALAAVWKFYSMNRIKMGRVETDNIHGKSIMLAAICLDG